MKKDVLMYIAIFITGASVLVLEVLGVRIVGPFYGSTIFVWTSAITVTLGALSLGYFVGGRLIDKKPDFRLFYLVIFFAGISFLLPMKIDQWILPLTDGLGIRYGPLMASFVLFFIPLAFLGMVSPMSVRLGSKDIKRTGNISGNIFTISTIGAIVGGLLSGFYLVGISSITQSLLFTSGLLAFIGALGYFLETKKKWLVLFLFLSYFLVFLIPPYRYEETSSVSILHQEQGYYGALKVVEVAGIRCVSLNGGMESCRKDGEPSLFFKDIAKTFNSMDVGRMLVLGSGGGDLMEAGLSTDIEVDLVDIDSRLVELSGEYLGFEFDVSKLQIDDARHFLATNKSKYDAIFLDVAKGTIPPYYMFSREAFKSLSGSLEDEGFVLINVLGGVGDRDTSVASIVKTAETIFPKVVVTSSDIETNGAYLIYLFPNEGTVCMHCFDTGFGEVTLDGSLGMVLTDDFNPLDVYFLEKSEVILEAVRKFGGFKTAFAL